MAKYQGQVTSWQGGKGFGFITPYTGGKQIFFHANVWLSENTPIESGTQVKYDLSTDNKGRPCAVNVEVVQFLVDGEPLEVVFQQWSSNGQLGMVLSEDHPKVKIVLPKSLWKEAPLQEGDRLKGMLRLHSSGSWVLLQPTLVKAKRRVSSSGVPLSLEPEAKKRLTMEREASASARQTTSNPSTQDSVWRENLTLSGVVTQWQDDKGYGFLKVAADKPNVFFHISDYIEIDGRPENDMVVRFVLRAGNNGQWRAGSAQCVQKAPQKKRLQGNQASRKKRNQAEGSALELIVAIVGGLGFLGLLTTLSKVLAAWCALMSVMSFMSYSSDKKAALRKKWRVSESRLHLQDLLGGWPGGWVARLMWHHKVSKSSFVMTFWLTVIINMVGTVWLSRQLADVLPTFIQ